MPPSNSLFSSLSPDVGSAGFAFSFFSPDFFQSDQPQLGYARYTVSSGQFFYLFFSCGGPPYRSGFIFDYSPHPPFVSWKHPPPDSFLERAIRKIILCPPMKSQSVPDLHELFLSHPFDMFFFFPISQGYSTSIPSSNFLTGLSFPRVPTDDLKCDFLPFFPMVGRLRHQPSTGGRRWLESGLSLMAGNYMPLRNSCPFFSSGLEILLPLFS